MPKTSPVILITGAACGIGKALALSLVQSGYTVYGAAPRLEDLDAFVAAGGHPLQMNVCNETAMILAVRMIECEHGAIDVLINNTNYTIYGAVEDVPLEEARRQFELNFFGLARLTQLAMPAMRERNTGRIVNISVMGGSSHFPLGAWYHSSKQAFTSWSDCLRLELAPMGIKVITVEPGILKTELVAQDLGPRSSKTSLLAELMGDLTDQQVQPSPYHGKTRALVAAMEQGHAIDSFACFAVLIEVIHQAITARWPKHYYFASRTAQPVKFAMRWLGERRYDNLITASTK